MLFVTVTINVTFMHVTHTHTQAHTYILGDSEILENSNSLLNLLTMEERNPDDNSLVIKK